MTIHHDKLAYGKLASDMEELSAEQLEQMIKQLNSLQEDNTDENNDKQNNNNFIKKL